MSISFRVFAPITLLALVTVQPAHAQNDTAQATLAWLKQVRGIQLEYHCRIKYGRNPKNVFIEDPEQIQAKWIAINEVPKAGLDPIVGNYYASLESFERCLQAVWKKTANAILWVSALEWPADVTGEPIQLDELSKLLKLPENRDELIGQVVKDSRKLGMLRHLLASEESHLRDNLSERYPAQAGAMLAAMDAPKDKTALALYERSWLAKNKPASLDRRNIKMRRKLQSLKDRLAAIGADIYADDMHQYGGQRAAIYSELADWAQEYEKIGLPEFAVSGYEAMLRAFFPAFQETMQRKARTLDPHEQWMQRMQALQLSTLTPYRAGRGREARLVVRPEDNDVLPQLAELAQEHLGFLGLIEAVETVVDLAVNGTGTRLVVLGTTGLEIYDLRTGQREHMLYPTRQNARWLRVAIPEKVDVAYVVDDSPRIFRVDLETGTIDESFSVKPPRRDVILAVSPDGSHLAVGFISKITVTNTRNGRQESEFPGPFNSLIYAMQFTPDGRSIIAGGNDSHANVYNWRKGKLISRHSVGPPDDRGGYAHAFVKTRSGYLLVGGGGHVTVYKGRREEPVFDTSLRGGGGFSGGSYTFRCVGLGPGARHVITEHGVWDLRSGEQLVAYQFGQEGKHHVLMPDGRRMAIAQRRSVWVVPIIVP